MANITIKIMIFQMFELFVQRLITAQSIRFIPEIGFPDV